jgi:hypothetical protein
MPGRPRRMNSRSNPKRTATGLTSLILSLVGIVACEDYNCADTATCASTPNNADVGDASVSSRVTDELSTDRTTDTPITSERTTTEHDDESTRSTISESSANSATTPSSEIDAASHGGSVVTDPATTELEASANTPIDGIDAGGVEASLGQACGSGADCSSGHCADGVCCETACDEVCATCNQPSNLGSCVTSTSDDACDQLVCPASTECRTYGGQQPRR